MESSGGRSKESVNAIVREFGEGDIVVEMSVNMAAMIKWALGVPDVYHLRVITRANFPSEGYHSYMTMPCDQIPQSTIKRERNLGKRNW